jgi:hypothetical protein
MVGVCVEQLTQAAVFSKWTKRDIPVISSGAEARAH